MDFKQIQELIKLVNRSNIGELTIEENSFRITIKQKEDSLQTPSSAAPLQTSYTPAPVQQPSASSSLSLPAAASPLPPASEAKSDNVITIKSPMIGTFYRSPAPDKPPLVSVGDEITPGKPVCIIEAMKLFNEIESEVSGRIVKVLVEDASPVEYDQPLFLVDPS
jgi:acetyl-CoA carboxylase biotin carboxyl carrier protein